MAKFTKQEISATLPSAIFILIMLSHFLFSIPINQEKLPFYFVAGLASFFPLARVISVKIKKK